MYRVRDSGVRCQQQVETSPDLSAPPTFRPPGQHRLLVDSHSGLNVSDSFAFSPVSAGNACAFPIVVSQGQFQWLTPCPGGSEA